MNLNPLRAIIADRRFEDYIHTREDTDSIFCISRHILGLPSGKTGSNQCPLQQPRSAKATLYPSPWQFTSVKKTGKQDQREVKSTHLHPDRHLLHDFSPSLSEERSSRYHIQSRASIKNNAAQAHHIRHGRHLRPSSPGDTDVAR
ncbi:hypothetical protein GJ744_003082 [Endocarpon pusillum]|uniref:Uncharacterized protein n=1 Tax=Endocarpon pusillum TaxID=364733 RepID=A0A8H7AQS9_9EURO|nr:hypothetical protein GJ744_003082 [Endocarpon pusillum]